MDEKPGYKSSEFLSMVTRHIVAVVLVLVGAFSGTEHGGTLIIGGLSLIGLDGGAYTLSRTLVKTKEKPLG